MKPALKVELTKHAGIEMCWCASSPNIKGIGFGRTVSGALRSFAGLIEERAVEHANALMAGEVPDPLVKLEPE